MPRIWLRRKCSTVWQSQMNSTLPASALRRNGANNSEVKAQGASMPINHSPSETKSWLRYKKAPMGLLVEHLRLVRVWRLRLPPIAVGKGRKGVSCCQHQQTSPISSQ